ncbi:MAG: hypothetical protein ACJAYU_004963 [Bradymonadia bacterium]|jgi:hypothetical protein
MKNLLIASLLVAAFTVPSVANAWQPLASCSPTWSDQPSPYHVNSNGYSRIDLSTVRQVFRDAFAEWRRPCCSDWEAVEVGTTSGVAEDDTNRQNIFSFRESAWPNELGNPSVVLAVTLTGWEIGGGGVCRNLTADMTFNAANHTFAMNDRSGVDLQAVTTHECGHWLGLSHSSVPSATMWPSYSSEEERTLHADDENGVCTLYPGDCGCATPTDCDPGDTCEDGVCVESPCASNSDCEEGLECDLGSGDCVVPPCRSDSDCAGAQVCLDGSCTIDADCPTCLPCEVIEDCGGGDWQCASNGSTGFCTRICNDRSQCPGNSDCFGIEGQTFAICLNDDAVTAGSCPGDFVCTEEPDICEGVSCATGEECNPATGACDPVAAVDDCIVCDECEGPADCPGGDCFDFGGPTGVCTIECSTAADCPLGTSCSEFGGGDGGTLNLCMNSDAQTVGVCPSSFDCENEPANPCGGVSCGAGEVCDPASGACVDDGAGEPDAGVPDTGTDGTEAECAICNSCSSDMDCPGGSCIEVGAEGMLCTIDCAENSGVCPGNTECFDVSIGADSLSLCLNADAGANGICYDAFICIDSGSIEPGDGVDAPGSGSDAGVTPVPFGGFPSQGGCVSSASNGRVGALWVICVMLVLRRRRRPGVV